MPPPHARPSSRDGRSGGFYYSNDDISILHEVVTKGEELLPDLPYRERLPTNALFKAAEEVLVRHGIDPDDDKFFNMIFKIGGHSDEDSLIDKFQSVMRNMGIEVEYVPDAAAVSVSAHSASQASSGHTLQSATFPISQDLHGRRRRNSDSVALPFVQADSLPRRRSASLVSSERRPGMEIPVIGNLPQRHIDPWLSQIPPYSHETDPDNVSHLQDDQDDDEEEDDDDDDEEDDLARSLVSGRPSEEFRNASDTTVQDEMMDGPPPKTDLGVMAKMASAFYLRSTLLLGLAAWYTTTAEHRERGRYAMQMDKEMTTSEIVLLWSDKAGTIVRDENGVSQSRRDSAAGDDTVPEGGHLQHLREAMMRRAARAYDISIMHKAFTHWQASAEDEADRTKVARRHILRKKLFGAWCDQNVSDDEKVLSRTLGKAIRYWSDAAEGRPGRNRSSSLRGMMEEVFWAWVTDHQDELGAGLRSANVNEDTVQLWVSETDRVINKSRDNETKASAVAIWRQKAAAVAVAVQRGADKNTPSYNTYLRTRTDHDTIAKVISTWTGLSQPLGRRSQQLEQDNVRNWVKHWRLETRLAGYRAEHEHDLKCQVFYDWMLEERLAFFQRYREDERKKAVIRTLRAAVRDDSRGAATARLADTADHFYKSHAALGFARAARTQWRDYDDRLATAQAMSQHVASTQAVDALADAAATHGIMDDMARRGAYYVGTANALDGWAAYAKKAREDRLRSTYRRFRREVKRDLAGRCAGAWRLAAAATFAQQQPNADADAFAASVAAMRMVDTINDWIVETNDKLLRRGVAEDEDAAAQVAAWRVAAARERDAAAAAADYDAYTRMKAGWDEWELQAVQASGRMHTAAELYEKNNRRLCRYTLQWWREEALLLPPSRPIPGHGLLLSSSSMSSSLRYTSVRRGGGGGGLAASAAAALVGGGGGGGSSSVMRRSYATTPMGRGGGGGGSRSLAYRLRGANSVPPPPPQPLGPMVEFDEDDDEDDDDEHDVEVAFRDTPSKMASTTPLVPLPSPLDRLAYRGR